MRTLSMQARILHFHIVELDKRIEKTDTIVTHIHGGRRCGMTFWCDGYCIKVRSLVEIREEKAEKLKHALVLMAAENIALAYGLNDDVLREIVDTACEKKLKRALALMAAEDIALEYGLNDDVLRAIVDTACENTI